MAEPLETIYRTLTEKLGYDVRTKVLDARTLVPQHRDRLFFVGFRNPTTCEWPQMPKTGPKFREILELKVDPKYTLVDHLWDTCNGTRRNIDLRATVLDSAWQT